MYYYFLCKEPLCVFMSRMMRIFCIIGMFVFNLGFRDIYSSMWDLSPGHPTELAWIVGFELHRATVCPQHRFHWHVSVTLLSYLKTFRFIYFSRSWQIVCVLAQAQNTSVFLYVLMTDELFLQTFVMHSWSGAE